MRRQDAAVGKRVRSPEGWTGTVVKVDRSAFASDNHVVVRWDKNGLRGRMNLALLTELPRTETV